MHINEPEKSNVKSIIITPSRPSAVGSRQPIWTLVAYANRRKSGAVLARERQLRYKIRATMCEILRYTGRYTDTFWDGQTDGQSWKFSSNMCNVQRQTIRATCGRCFSFSKAGLLKNQRVARKEKWYNNKPVRQAKTTCRCCPFRNWKKFLCIYIPKKPMQSHARCSWKTGEKSVEEIGSNKDAPFNFVFSLSFGFPADPVFVQLPAIGANMQLPSNFSISIFWDCPAARRFLVVICIAYVDNEFAGIFEQIELRFPSQGKIDIVLRWIH